ncbi:MAG TPA: (d)CMP kinase [Streptosporangiaceae bacterium]|nr:(d)CMP kinase [Streptosporangiaceae bacterium]
MNPSEPDEALVIAVDGPSGSGKSSAARGVATALGLRYLDTGAMYRAVTWWMLAHQVDLADADSVIKQALRLPVELSTDPGAERVLVDGTEVTAQIRERAVSNAVSRVAALPPVRSYLIAMQRQIIADAVTASGGIVAEGRDIGTVVAPDATVKVFLTASEQARAERRTAELTSQTAAAASQPDAELTRREQATRDRLDAPQTQQATDAVEIDATELGLAEVIARIVSLARSNRAKQ